MIVNNNKVFMEYVELITVLGVAVIGFIGWLVKEKFTLLDNVERRTTNLEAKLNVLGDINEILGGLKTDIAVIKNSLESYAKDNKDR